MSATLAPPRAQRGPTSKARPGVPPITARGGGEPADPPTTGVRRSGSVPRGPAGTAPAGETGLQGGGGRPCVLVLRALGLGDLLAGVPALRALRRAFPGHEVVLAAPGGLREAVAAVDAVDRLFPAEAPARGVPSLRGWTEPPPDVAVDLHGNGPASRDALAALRPGRLLAFAGPHAPGEPQPRWRPDEHERARWCRLLEVYGIAADPADLRLPPPAEPSPAPGAVVVHPGANAAARRWPAERYAAVVAELRASGHDVVISGGPGDEEQVAALAARTGVPVHQNLPYRRFAALIAHASALLSADTGPAHLAVAYATPSVTLFGPVAPALWGPPPDPRHLALHHPSPPTDPNAPTPDPTLLRITPTEVTTALTTLPPPTPAPHPPPPTSPSGT